jgi:hypothetical protein
MRRLTIGLSAAFAMAAAIGVTATFAAKDAAIDAVTPLVQAAGISCTPTAARTGGDVMTSDKSPAKIYEIACQEGMGYVLIAKKPVGTAPAEAPQAYSCMMANAPGADGKPTPLACKLPANAHPEQGLQPLVTATGHSCQVDKARMIGLGATQTYYEVACKDGSGYIVQAPLKAGGPAVSATTCLAFGSESKVKCTLSNPAAQLGVVDGLAAATGKCTPKDRRYVATDAAGTDYFEVACTDGKGYILHADATGHLKETIDCAVASGIAGGCTMTDSRAALTQQSALYTGLAKKAGFDCDVSRYGPIPVRDTSNEVVELQCSNRADGGIGIFPLHGGRNRVLDCVRSVTEGYRCSFSKESAVLPKLNAQLRGLNKGSCVVNGARAFGTSDQTDFIEVSCADGGPGWVVTYAKASESPNGVLNCAQAAGFGTGGCQLPTNVKK